MGRRCLLFGSIVSFAVIVQTAAGIETVQQAEAWRTLQRSFPGAKAYTAGDLVLSVYGRAMDTGDTPEAAAAQFRSSSALVFGVSSDELQTGLARRGGRQSQPVFYEAEKDRFKFTLFYYSQFIDDIPVFRAELRVLVRNESPFPVVLANSSLRPLGAFVVAGRAAQADAAAGIDSVKRVAPHLDRVIENGLVIWAGVDEQLAEPRLAYRIAAENAKPERWLYLVDAETGEILYSEDRIQHVDVTGSVIGNGTGDAKADTCSNEVRLTMPYSLVNIGATSAFADKGGVFTLPNGGATDVTVDSPIRGEWFRVFNFIGADEQLSLTVTPPGPANFTHNGASAESVRAQVNGYVGANIVRDHMLTYNPLYPTLNATDSPVVVNRTDGFCPGNAWWDPSDLSINFCLSGGSPNTAFGSVIYHEYGHHVVNAAGSGQGQYGEGMGDVLSVIITDDPGLGYGFSGNCGATLRNAVNNLQYPCTFEAHNCAGLISGAVWETRNELIITEPADYRDIISNLSVNAILMHTGSTITPQITIDFLTLDDDDADLGNGAPHWNEICAGFGEHNLSCPLLAYIEFEYPNGLPELVAPGAATIIRVDVVSNIVAPIETTGTVSYRIGESGAFTTDPMTEIAPNQYEAVLPANQCGDAIQFFFTAVADSSGGLDISDPLDSPNGLYSSIAATAIVPVAAFDFQSTTGWTVSGNATDGQWNAGIPAAGNRGDPPNDFDGSGSCFLTDNVAGNSDVDGGTTILTSPSFDLTGMNKARVSYARWYSNTEGDSPQADTFFINVSNDGANFVNMETVGPTGEEVSGGWFTRSFRVADTVTPSGNVQFRFEVGDLGAGSIVEAAIDAFEIINVVCGAETPTIAASPHDIRKNRYISFQPGNAGQQVKLQVTLSDSLVHPGLAGSSWWVQAPIVPLPDQFPKPLVGAGECVARLGPESTAAELDWIDAGCQVLHVTGCPIEPTSEYEVQAVAGVDASAGLLLQTALQPAEGRWWGDTVGIYDGTVWTPPQGVANIDDTRVAITTFQGGQIVAPSGNVAHLSVPDVVPGNINTVVNFDDVLILIKAFQGETYPFGPADSDGNCP